MAGRFGAVGGRRGIGWLACSVAGGSATDTRAAEAQERSARELEMARDRHRAEMDGQSQRARVERRHLVNQLQRQAVVEVSRAASGHTRALASLWQEGARVLSSEDRDERERAMKPVFEQIGRAVTDFSVELGGALLVVDDEHLHRALEGVNEAVLLAVRVAEELYGRLAWSLLRTGLDETAGEVKTP